MVESMPKRRNYDARVDTRSVQRSEPPLSLLAPAPDDALEDPYRALLSCLPDTMIAQHDRELQGVSVEGSPATALGFDRARFVGATIRKTVPPDIADRLEPACRSALEGRRSSFEHRLADGRVFRMEAVPLRERPDAQVSGVLTVARELSGQDDVQQEARMRTSQQAAVAELGLAALEGLGLSHLMDRAVSLVASTLEVEFCDLLELTEERESMLLRAGVGWKQGLVRRAQVPAGSQWQAGFTWGSRGAVVVEDYAQERRFSPTPILRDHSVASGVSVIVGAKRHPVGILGAHTAAPRRFRPHEVDFLQAVANILAEALARDLAEGRVRHQALHDPLTGLANRTLIMERLEHWLQRARRSSQQGALLFMDLDCFKSVNDRHGHSAGDKLICAAAERLTATVRPSETVARMGGDEFLVLCEELRDDHEAIGLAERLLNALEQPFAVAGIGQQITASVGLVVSDGGTTPDAMIRDADTAMYRAKERGGGRLELFDEAMREWSYRWREKEADLRRGLAEDEFQIVYQPIVNPLKGSLIGFEALVRWEHPVRGTVLPDEFIPTAEETGLIVELGASVLHQACSDAVSWSRDDLRVSVNVSPKQLAHRSLVPSVKKALADTALPAHRLSLELTETALIDDAAGALEKLVELKDLGLYLELDDFGTGYSSLTFARTFPIDALKIDRSFVEGLAENDEDHAIVSAVVSMARALGLGVVAEGVETPEQATQLRLMGCGLAQGYLYSRPLSPAAALELADATRSRTPFAA